MTSSAVRVKDLYEDIQIVRDMLTAHSTVSALAFERILHAAAGPLSGRHDLNEAARRLRNDDAYDPEGMSF